MDLASLRVEAFERDFKIREALEDDVDPVDRTLDNDFFVILSSAACRLGRPQCRRKRGTVRTSIIRSRNRSRLDSSRRAAVRLSASGLVNDDVRAISRCHAGRSGGARTALGQGRDQARGCNLRCAAQDDVFGGALSSESDLTVAETSRGVCDLRPCNATEAHGR